MEAYGATETYLSTVEDSVNRSGDKNMLQQIHLTGPDLAQELVHVFRKYGVGVESGLSGNSYKINQLSCYLTYHNWPLEENYSKHPGKYFFNINDSSLQDDQITLFSYMR
jgi:hypothetical protein